MPEQTATLTPLALKDAPALIETVFPAQKVSFEAQKERKAGAGQTLTALGSYWKGRKPLILVRAILLGCLLPPTDDAEADLAIFEKLLSFDEDGLTRRALDANGLSPKEIALRVQLNNPWDYFQANTINSTLSDEAVSRLTFPLDADEEGLLLRWRRDVSEAEKLDLYRQTLATFSSYEAKASFCKRPEEVDQAWLYAPVWPALNRHYSHLGLDAHSFPELVEQLGLMRYGRRPRVGDTFSGGGSVPFESARIGCDVYASDLNPIACMLTWGALNIIGAHPDQREVMEQAQREVFKAVDEDIAKLDIEYDKEGNRAKAYLYCLEVRCPETGWMIPLSPSWVISKSRHVIARLSPDYANKRFDIEVASNVSRIELKAAEKGTIQNGEMVYELDDQIHHTPIKTLRGDYRKSDGSSGNSLRSWEKGDFMPCLDDIFQERLYCVYWMDHATLTKWRPTTYFASVTMDDLNREATVKKIVAENLAQWQREGLVPDMSIEPGEETTRLLRERGWTHWHHLFNARNILYLALYKKYAKVNAVSYLYLAELLNYFSRLCSVKPGGAGSRPEEIWIGGVFSNQALNTFYNYGSRAFSFAPKKFPKRFGDLHGVNCVQSGGANEITSGNDLFITDPPYADAVNYHEITEFFIAWLRKNPPKPFDEWIWDSRRALAIKGSGDDFRHGMVAAYKAMTEHMPDNGLQCVMFTHQDTSVWSDLIGIFWAAGLQVVAAWYIATETTSELKKGGYVQGTVILLLKKRPAGERIGFKQQLFPVVRREVESQINAMMHLNDTMKAHHGSPVFNDSDLQMAGYAAALKVLTAYTKIGGEDVTSFALRPRAAGETTVVDEIVQQAAETASNLLTPPGLSREVWSKLEGIERFVLQMLHMETSGAHKLDNYQNFAKAFRVIDYTKVMGDMRPNKARLKRVTEYTSRDLTDATELGPTRLGRLIIGLHQRIADDLDPQRFVEQLRAEMTDRFLETRPILIEMLAFIERNATSQEVRDAADVLGGRLKNLRLGE
jgi:adenine-specific DNA methylase